MADVFKWLGAYVVVYSRMLHRTSRSRLGFIAAVVFALIIAALLGPVGTLAVLFVALFILPAINTELRREVDNEYKKRNPK